MSRHRSELKQHDRASLNQGCITYPLPKIHCFVGTVAIVSDGNGEGYVLEEARLAASALGCYAYKLGGASTAGLSSLLPNISGTKALRLFPRIFSQYPLFCKVDCKEMPQLYNDR